MTRPIQAPAGFVPADAIAFGGVEGEATFVDPDHPLPVRHAIAAAASTPLAGTAAAATVAGPFVPERGRAIWLTLTGAWTGTARLLRSTDAGASRTPLTLGGQAWATFTANCNEPVGEESDASATYYLDLAITGGSVGYRVAQ